MYPTSTFRAQCSVKKSQSNCGSQEYLKILPYNIMTLTVANFLKKVFLISVLFLPPISGYKRKTSIGATFANCQ